MLMAPRCTFCPRAGSVIAGFVAAWIFAGVTTAPAKACETPVYRYAMYRWQPAPYEVYFFHDGPVAEPHRLVGTTIEEVSEGSDNRANLVYLPVHLGDDPELLSVPPDVKQAWLSKSERSSPGYLVSTPYGAELFSGPLDGEAIRALVDSPARKSLAAQLEAGKVGVFLFLKCSDEGANDRARAVLNEVVHDVAAGTVSLYEPPSELAENEGTGEEENDTAEDGQPVREVGLIEIDRASDEERWLVKSLLTVEPDLKDEDRPMAFLVYGRARALLPYIGEGISRENLLREIEFISGACSCTVKEQNPGVDLLVRYDWESAAVTLAERVGSEEGNESRFGSDMFFPELIIPSAAASTAVAEAAEDAPPSSAEAAANGDDSTLTPEPPDKASAGSSAAAGEQADPPRVEVAAVTPVAATDGEPPDNAAYSSILIVGAGLAVALMVLFGITLIVLRPQ